MSHSKENKAESSKNIFEIEFLNFEENSKSKQNIFAELCCHILLNDELQKITSFGENPSLLHIPLKTLENSSFLHLLFKNLSDGKLIGSITFQTGMIQNFDFHTISRWLNLNLIIF